MAEATELVKKFPVFDIVAVAEGGDEPARAAIASRTLDIPTRSAPMIPAIRTSAGVSYCGPRNCA